MAPIIKMKAAPPTATRSTSTAVSRRIRHSRHYEVQKNEPGLFFVPNVDHAASGAASLLKLQVQRVKRRDLSSYATAVVDVVYVTSS